MKANGCQEKVIGSTGFVGWMGFIGWSVYLFFWHGVHGFFLFFGTDYTDCTDVFLCSGIRASVFAYGYAATGPNRRCGTVHLVNWRQKGPGS
jgi:hypothetical protein